MLNCSCTISYYSSLRQRFCNPISPFLMNLTHPNGNPKKYLSENERIVNRLVMKTWLGFEDYGM